MESYEHHEIVIVGGGICGLATALAFHRKGIKCTVLERSETVRATGAAIIMLPNGWRALEHLGVADELRKTANIIKEGYRTFVSTGKRVKLPLGYGEIRCVKRQDLVRVLAENLPEGTVQCGSRVVSLKIPEESHSIIHLDNGRILRAKFVIGCDGVHSIVSEALGLSPVKVINTSVIRGFTYYPNGHDLPPQFSNYTSQNGQFGYLPMDDKYVFWFMTSIKKTQDVHQVKNKSDIIEIALDFIKGYDHKYIEMVNNCDMEVLHLQTNLILRSPFDMFTSNFRKGTVTVAGDAFHAMGPFMAQGAAVSLEDAIILARTVASSITIDGTTKTSPVIEKKDELEQKLDTYLGSRKTRAFWIMSQTFLTGIIAGSITVKPFRILGIFLFFLLFGRDPSAFARFDCGPL